MLRHEPKEPNGPQRFPTVRNGPQRSRDCNTLYTSLFLYIEPSRVERARAVQNHVFPTIKIILRNHRNPRYRQLPK